MFNLFGKKSKERPPTPAWVKWMVLLFVVYAIFTNHHRERLPKDSALYQSLATAEKELDPSNFIDLESYKNKIFPDGGALKVHDIALGKGNPAVCGQEVKIAYSASIGKDKPVDDNATKDNPLAYRIGEGKAMPALEEGVIGMQQGGKRAIIAKYDLTYGSAGHTREDVPKDAVVRLEVELLSATPKLPDIETTPFRIFDTALGRGHAALCGKPMTVRLSMWDVAGKTLYLGKEMETFTFTPGKSETFLGLEQGTIGMREGGRRTLIVPPDFQKPMHANTPLNLPFPKNAAVLVDVQLLEVK